MANKTKIVHVAIEPKIFEMLQKLAVKKDCPVSQIVRSAIRNILVSEKAVL